MFNLPRKPGQEPLKITRAQWVAIQQKYGQTADGEESFLDVLLSREATTIQVNLDQLLAKLQ